MNKARLFITVYLLTGFFAVLGWMFYVGAAQEQIALMIGALIGMAVRGPNWYLDSSPGSERKTELLAKASPVPDPPAHQPDPKGIAP